ncbi:YajG family lipoprotein [Arsukibacterium sp.]|uniref:YajG family lipoprotein n=1 Tax=Arsukibacterium sp. TaxID=1977258 RepID=UPI002FD9600F
MRYLLVLTFLLAGCSSPAPRFILEPQVFWPQEQRLTQTEFSFALNDQRPYRHTLTIRRGDSSQQQATSNDLRATLEQNLQQALMEQGARINANSSVKLTIQLNQLQATINQRPLDHEVINQVAMTVMVQHPDGQFSKPYGGDSRFTAPFRADIAAVERELRILTEQVINQILQDSSWQTELRRR